MPSSNSFKSHEINSIHEVFYFNESEKIIEDKKKPL